MASIARSESGALPIGRPQLCRGVEHEPDHLAISSSYFRTSSLPRAARRLQATRLKRVTELMVAISLNSVASPLRRGREPACAAPARSRARRAVASAAWTLASTPRGIGECEALRTGGLPRSFEASRTDR